jgi:antitoxin component YwqK of YwqJK toxin-antitoxin module
MTAHKYAAGQSVRYSPHRFEDGSARGVYTIVRQLPETGDIPQYRIKAKADGRERVVREDQLVRAT